MARAPDFSVACALSETRKKTVGLLNNLIPTGEQHAQFTIGPNVILPLTSASVPPSVALRISELTLRGNHMAEA